MTDKQPIFPDCLTSPTRGLRAALAAPEQAAPEQAAPQQAAPAVPTRRELPAIKRYYNGTDRMAESEGGDWVTYDAHAAAMRAALAAPQQAAPAEITDYQILAITTAYEQGVGKGRQAHESGKEISNPYSTGYRCDLAWQYGYDEGKEQAERIAKAAPQQEVPVVPYSIDADPQGIRATVADAITGALAFGAQGANPPPTGHWLAPFWESARQEASRNAPVTSYTLYLLRRLLSNQHTLTGSEFREELEKIVNEAAAPQQAAPAGEASLPVEITPEMRKAAADAWLDCGSKLLLNKAAAALKAGIAAAPKAPQQAAPAMPSEIALMEKAARRVGITSLLNHGAASCVYSEGCAGVSQEHLLAYTRDIALHCAVALAAPQQEVQEPTALHQVYRCKIKSRRQIDKEIPREQQGWWADVSAGQTLLLRQAVQSDLDRCTLGGKRSKNPDDYMCETHTSGSLVSKIALEYMNPVQNVFASTAQPAPSGDASLPPSYLGSVLSSSLHGNSVTFNFGDRDEAERWHDAVADAWDAARKEGK